MTLRTSRRSLMAMAIEDINDTIPDSTPLAVPPVSEATPAVDPGATAPAPAAADPLVADPAAAVAAPAADPLVDPLADPASVTPAAEPAAALPVDPAAAPVAPVAPVADPVADPAAAVPTDPATLPAADPAPVPPVAEPAAAVVNPAVAPAVDPAAPVVNDELELGEGMAIGDADEVAEAGDDIEADVSDVQDAGEDAAALDNIAGAVSEAADGEGLTPAAAQAVDIAVESICNRLGIKRAVTPAAEAFGSTNSRKKSTRLAAEAIGENAKRIWDVIAKFFKDAVIFVKGFIQKVFTQNGQVKTAAAKIIAAAKSGKYVGGGKVDGGSFAPRLSLKGQVSPSITIEGLGKLATTTTLILDGVAQFGKDSAAKVPELLKGVIDAQAFTINTSFMKAFPNEEPHDKGGNAITYSTGALLGDATILVGIRNHAIGMQMNSLAVSVLSSMSTQLVRDDNAFKGGEVAAATASEAVQIAEAVLKLSQVVEGKKAALDACSQALDATFSKMTGVKYDWYATHADAKNFLRVVGATLSNLPSRVMTLDMGAAKAALHYAQASLKGEAVKEHVNGGMVPA